MRNLFTRFNNLLNRLLFLFGLRKAFRNWGIIYDSVSKQPLDPVVVKLINADTGKVVSTCITNIKGRYGFLSYPGRFVILPKKSNYVFPSKRVSGYSDQGFNNLYHGELFELEGGADVLPFNIPMDPVAFDWNQKAKQQFNNSRPFFDFFTQTLIKIIFWAGLILALFFYVYTKSLVSRNVLIFYGFMLLLAIFTPEMKLWGRLTDKSRNGPLANAKLELSYVEAKDITVASAHTLEDGKFFLYAEPGKYLLKISKTDLSGQNKLIKTTKVSVGRHGVFNLNIKV